MNDNSQISMDKLTCTQGRSFGEELSNEQTRTGEDSERACKY